MPTASTVAVPYDPEWAGSLRTMRMKIPSSIWPGFEDCDDLNDGYIVSIDWSKPNRAFFQVSVDGHVYPFRYEAIFLYADVNQEGFQRFDLPRYPIRNPDGETHRVSHRRVQVQSDGETASTCSVTTDEASSSESDEDEQGTEYEFTTYIRTDPEDWTCLEDGDLVLRIHRLSEHRQVDCKKAAWL